MSADDATILILAASVSALVVILGPDVLVLLWGLTT